MDEEGFHCANGALDPAFGGSGHRPMLPSMMKTWDIRWTWIIPKTASLCQLQKQGQTSCSPFVLRKSWCRRYLVRTFSTKLTEPFPSLLNWSTNRVPEVRTNALRLIASCTSKVLCVCTARIILFTIHLRYVSPLSSHVKGTPEGLLRIVRSLKMSVFLKLIGKIGNHNHKIGGQPPVIFRYSEFFSDNRGSS